MSTPKLSCVAVSDTHGMYEQVDVPNADVYIHAGDITRSGKLSEIKHFNNYLSTLPHKHKIIIAGNHDWGFERSPDEARNLITNGTYLEDESVTINGFKFYGSPWQPWFLNWAFNLHRGKNISSKWDLIENDTDVLITHGPAFGILDRVLRGESVGCSDLLDTINKIKPKYHICGHIHEAYGTDEVDNTRFINASSCTIRYEPTNKPIEFLLER